MAERLEIALELMNVSGLLGDFQRIIDATEHMNRATGGSGGAGGDSAALAFTRLSVVLGGTIAGFSELAKRVQQAAETVERFNRQTLLSGGTGRETALGRAIANATGISDLTNLGAQLRARISGGGLARIAASRLGIGSIPPPGMGFVDEAQLALTIIERMRGMSATAAQEFADQLGARELVLARQLTDERQRGVQRIADMESRLMNTRQIQESQHFMDRLRQIAMVVESNAISFGTKFLDQYAISNMGPFGMAAMALRGFFFGSPFGGGGNGSVENQASAMERNTSALDRNTIVIDRLRQVIGGGERARGAIPAGLRGETLRKWYEGEAAHIWGQFHL